MLTYYDHTLNQVRKQPGSPAPTRYHSSAPHPGDAIWSKDHHGNWHLIMDPSCGMLSPGDMPRERIREQARFT